MDKETTATNLSHFPLERRAVPATPYLEKVQELSLSPQRALSVVVDCTRFNTLHSSHQRPVDYLLLELRLWASILGARPIDSVFLQHPYQHLEPFELTRLLHEIACRFRVKRSGEKKYVVTSEGEQISSAHLALIKGMGFCCYQIVVSEQQLANIEALAKKIRLIRDFNIRLIGVQLLHTDCVNEMSKAIKKLQDKGAPDYVCLGNPWETMNILSGSQPASLDFNHQPNIDIIELGPDARSHIDETSLQNYSAIEKYTASLDVSRLPIVIHQLNYPSTS